MAEPDRRTATACFGGLLLVGAVLLVVDGVRLRGAAPGAVLGPEAVPLAVGVLLGVVGAALLVRALRTPPGAAAETSGRSWLRVSALVAVLVAFAFLLGVLGFVVSATGLFVAAALLLGAPHPLRVVGYGWALAALVFLVFDRLIGLSLPAGPWGF
ncbi:tripartite tricarboxylate transporter TctB family protein [Saccharopolyspora cebuensis]|uniref:Tripartite tricarboxylate transporter TctB family protein n=1 Tax=Saccharopolyspora cebuensis TaxID=418759 RepID=A0ABV4CQ66_9PSEU